jgi:TetR/AcrR family transcriptional regulator
VTASGAGGEVGGRVRDAARSREAILEAAEGLFAERGFDGTSLHEIATVAGLARATPSYFFGSKEGLYVEVLRRVVAAREAALAPVFRPLHQWAAESGDEAGLERAVRGAVTGYLRFLDERPSFARLIEWEALTGAERLHETVGSSTAISDALRAVHDERAERGLRDFDPTQVVVAFVSLCFLPVAHQATFAGGGEIDTTAPEFRSAYRDQVTELVLFMMRGCK